MRELESVADDALEIKNISGKVEEWEIPNVSLEGEQMSIFDMTSEPKSEMLHFNPEDDKKAKCEMWAAYLRKGIRTLDMELAGYAIHNLRQTDLSYVWKTLYAISRNECKGIPTREIVSLKQSDEYVNKNKGLDKRDEIYICKGIMVLMYQICGKFSSTIGNDIMDAEFLVRWDDHEFIDIRNCNLPDDIVPERWFGMKIKNVYDIIFSMDNLYDAFLDASNGRRYNRDVLRFGYDSWTNLEELRERILRGEYEMGDRFFP